MSLHHYGGAADSEAFNTKRRWLYSFLYFLQHFLLSFFEFFIFLDNFPWFDLRSVDSTIKALGDGLLAQIALGLLESKHVFQTSFMDTVIAVPQHDSQCSLFNTHVTIGALGILLHLRLVPLAFLLSCHLLITASEEFGKRDRVASVL